jgi:hypothetical protein
MNAGDALRAWASFSAVPATYVLACVRPDWSPKQMQDFFKNRRQDITLQTCSFGRRGNPQFAVRGRADAEAVLQLAGASGTCLNLSAQRIAAYTAFQYALPGVTWETFVRCCTLFSGPTGRILAFGAWDGADPRHSPRCAASLLPHAIA